MINDSWLFYSVESKKIISPNKSGFRNGTQTKDSVVCLEDEIWKAEVNKDIVGGVFLD